MSTAPKTALDLFRRVMPHGAGRIASDRGQHRLRPAPYGHGFVVTAAIPELGVQPGDVVFVCLSHGRRSRGELRAVRGSIRNLPRQLFSRLLAAWEQLEFVESSWDDDGQRARDTVSRISRRLQGPHPRNGATAPDSTSPVLIIRPWRVSSMPVVATSDDAAIAELLLDLGCRPPKEGA